MPRTQKAAPTNIRFELLAPRNESVALLGNWNEWEPIEMVRGDDGVWRIEVALRDGHYAYKFRLVSEGGPTAGKQVDVADPQAPQFSKDTDTSDCSVIQIKEGKPVITSYQWQHDNVPLPPNEQLIIYEMHLGDFRGGPGDEESEAGDFRRVLEKLDYLVELGVNALQFMPVNETDAENYWGYSQRSLYAVENTYGTPEELCLLIDECHRRGIRVIHDAVFNHVDPNAPLTRIDFTYWFYEKNPDEPDLQFGPKLNFEFYDETHQRWPAREHVLGAIQQWVSTFHVDGIRFDSTRAIRHYDVLRLFNEHAHHHAGGKPFLTAAEHLPQDPSITGTGGPLDSAWHENFYHQLVATVLGIPHDDHEPFQTDDVVKVLSAHSDGFASNYNVINYLNNHDQERIMYQLGGEANTFDDEAFQRAKLGAGLLLTAPGIPMLWMGEEFGQATRKSEARQPLHWSLLGHERNQQLWERYRLLIRLRKQNPALYSDNFRVIATLSGRGVIVYKRWNNEGNVIIIIANLRPVDAGTIELTSEEIENGRWCEAIHNEEIVVEHNRLTASLAASELKLYIKQ